MSLVKISQFSSHEIPPEVLERVQTFSRQFNGRPLSKKQDTQILVAFQHNELVGFAEIKLSSPTAILRNIATEKSHREQHLGLKLLRTCLMRAVVAGSQRVQLACKAMHIGFFRNGGFTVQERTSSSTTDDQYFVMENPCPALFLSTTQSKPTDNLPLADSSALVNGEDTNVYRYTNENKYLHLHHRMLSQAGKEIWILAESMSNPVLSDAYTNDCLIRLVKRNPKTDVRIMLMDDKVGARQYNPVLQTIQRLSSYVDVRVLHQSGMQGSEIMTLVDYSSNIYRKNVNNYSGLAHFNNRILTHRLRDSFEQQWRFAKPSAQLKRLVM